MIEKHFKQLTTIKEYAEELSISAKYLSHCIKKTQGINALRLLNRVRINYAKSLMLYTEMNASQIAYELNFSEPAYFYTLLKQVEGKTPGEHRTENLK